MDESFTVDLADISSALAAVRDVLAPEVEANECAQRADSLLKMIQGGVGQMMARDFPPSESN